MANLLAASRVEARKAVRSKVFWVTLVGFLLIPSAGTLFMLILQYPEQAKALGIVAAKAQLLTLGPVGWQSYLGFLLMGLGIGGTVIASFVAAWVFGREYVDKTLRSLLSLPTTRTTIVLAKFIIVSLWSFLFSSLAFLVGVVLGSAIDLPGWNVQLLVGNASKFAIVSVLGIFLAWAVGLVANLAKSYFAAIGFLIFMAVLAQIVQVLGWGRYFPWAIPGLYSNVSAPTQLGAASYLIVFFTGLLGLAGTILWWQYADHRY